MSRIRDALDKKETGRYIVVGVISTTIDFCLLFTFKALGLPITLSNIGSTGTSFIFSFFANKKFTFKSNKNNIIREIFLFIAVTLFGLWVIQTIIIHLAMPMLGHFTSSQDLALFLAKLIATGVTMIWNFVLYKFIVFKEFKSADKSGVS
ncbi:MAG: GtrA family protein [Candidatus Saccharimonas sp.]